MVAGCKVAVKTKRCIKCDKRKAVTGFSKNNYYSDGRLSFCTACRKKYRRLLRLKNPAAVNESQRRYRAEHRERIRE